jgi:hypothetical protein
MEEQQSLVGLERREKFSFLLSMLDRLDESWWRTEKLFSNPLNLISPEWTKKFSMAAAICSVDCRETFIQNFARCHHHPHNYLDKATQARTATRMLKCCMLLISHRVQHKKCINLHLKGEKIALVLFLLCNIFCR